MINISNIKKYSNININVNDFKEITNFLKNKMANENNKIYFNIKPILREGILKIKYEKDKITSFIYFKYMNENELHVEYIQHYEKRNNYICLFSINYFLETQNHKLLFINKLINKGKGNSELIKSVLLQILSVLQFICFNKSNIEILEKTSKLLSLKLSPLILNIYNIEKIDLPINFISGYKKIRKNGDIINVKPYIKGDLEKLEYLD